MFSELNFDKSKPVYLQLKDYIKKMILSGMLQKNEKLPSTRELSEILNLSRNTVTTAYEYLEDEGFVHIIKGKGAFTSDVKINKAEKWNIDWNSRVSDYGKNAEKLDIVKSEVSWKKGMISFKSISPDNSLFDVEEVKRGILNRFAIEGDKILNYGYAIGYKPLIDYLMTYMKSKGINIEEKGILVTNGFTEGFDISLSALTEKGDSIICENPTHNTALKIMKLHELNIIGVDMEDDGININKLKEKVSENKPKLAYLIPSYHNPTGIVMPPDKRKEVFETLKKHEIPIVEDGFNEELRYSGAHVSPMAALCGDGNSVVYIGSFSKILFPGIRVGWILADSKLINYLESIKRSRNIHTSFLDQVVLYEYLNSGSFEKYIKKARKVYKEKYDLAIEYAQKYIDAEKIWGQGGLHIFIKLGGISSREVLKECLKDNVIFTPGDIFYVNGDNDDTMRLGFGKLSEEEIKEGIKIIGKSVEKVRR